ncbi:hypothetical protein PIB30_008281 [Stylosanthes scabra]|uniref:Uncharacterized protein n=1 Tax=Stylosanthes scabra TaxID=79078 RepID=A0ABU6R5B5_9FABA|nr:hypothetical protein [Stylosanthes scabra]
MEGERVLGNGVEGVNSDAVFEAIIEEASKGIKEMKKMDIGSVVNNVTNDTMSNDDILSGLILERDVAHFSSGPRELDPMVRVLLGPVQDDERNSGPGPIMVADLVHSHGPNSGIRSASDSGLMRGMDPINLNSVGARVGGEENPLEGNEQHVDSITSGSDYSCPFPPGFGHCAAGHVHRNGIKNPLDLDPSEVEDRDEVLSSGLRELGSDENVFVPSSLLSPVCEARRVIRVCEDGGLCFHQKEKKLIELKLADVDERTGVNSYNLRSKRSRGTMVKYRDAGVGSRIEFQSPGVNEELR